MSKVNNHIPTLKRISSVKVLISTLEKAFGDRILLPSDVCFNNKTNTYLAEDIVKSNLQKYELHLHLKKELIALSKCISIELYEWYNIVKSNGYPDVTFLKLIWSQNGTINKLAMVKVIITRETRDKKIAYSCMICDEDLIRQYMVPNACKIVSTKLISADFLKYWLDLCCNRLQTVTNESMFHISMLSSNEFGVKHFWSKLGEENRKSGFQKIVSNYFRWQQGVYLDILIYLLDNSTEKERIFFYSLYALPILKSLVFHWINMNIFLKTFAFVVKLRFLTHEDFIHLCRYILLEVRPNYPLHENREILFCEIWRIFECESPDGLQLTIQGTKELQTILFQPLDTSLGVLKFLANNKMFDRIKLKVLNAKSAQKQFLGLVGQRHGALKEFLNALQFTEEEYNGILQDLKQNLKGFDEFLYFRSDSCDK